MLHRAHQDKLENDNQLEMVSNEMELGKQRENKLMFFLYVLKEERQCPVSEVFEEYIKPIKTSRFKADFGEDYAKVLRQVKKQMKYEKLYDKAVKKLKLMNGRREYLSDTCLPVTYHDNSYDFPPKPSKFDRNFQKKKVKRKSSVVTKHKIPKLDMMKLAANNLREERVINNHKFETED